MKKYIYKNYSNILVILHIHKNESFFCCKWVNKGNKFKNISIDRSLHSK